MASTALQCTGTGGLKSPCENDRMPVTLPVTLIVSAVILVVPVVILVVTVVIVDAKQYWWQ